MSEKKIENIVEELRSEEERLKKELADLKKREQEVTRDLKTVQSGLAGMGGKAAGKTRKRSSRKAASETSSPAPAAENQSEELALEAFP